MKSPPFYGDYNVAPPRGERGLKCVEQQAAGKTGQSRSPSWGAWIEMYRSGATVILYSRRSPSWGAWIEIFDVICLSSVKKLSLPLVGSVD